MKAIVERVATLRSLSPREFFKQMLVVPHRTDKEVNNNSLL